MTASSRRRDVVFGAAAAASLTGRPGMVADVASDWQVPLPAGITPAPPEGRLVAISYTNWFHSRATDWNNEWGMPALGTYVSTDPAILRQHALWLNAAGVDFILLDLSNEIGADWLNRTGDSRSLDRLDATIALFEAWSGLPNAPRICIMLGGNPPEVFQDGRLDRKLAEIAELFTHRPRYAKLIQHYLGKPLLVIFVGPSSTSRLVGKDLPGSWENGVPPWMNRRFAVRFMGGYVSDQPNLLEGGTVSKYGYWSWEDRGPPSFPIVDGHPEIVTIVAAWTGQSPTHAPEGRRGGATFLRDWAYARRIGPRIALVTTFNEWWRGEQPNAEFSRDIEPSREFGDLYLRLLTQQAALFKAGA